MSYSTTTALKTVKLSLQAKKYTSNQPLKPFSNPRVLFKIEDGQVAMAHAFNSSTWVQRQMDLCETEISLVYKS